MNKPSFKILFFLLIFCFSFSVWISPVVFKGHAPYKIKDTLLLARNLHVAGEYGYENGKNVILAPSLAKDEAEKSLAGNRLTAYLYSFVFDISGVLSPDNLVIFSIFLHSLSLLVFSIIAYRLCGFRVAALFSAIYTLIPFNWQQIYSLGSYEFAIFFLSLFLAFFILASEDDAPARISSGRRQNTEIRIPRSSAARVYSFFKSRILPYGLTPFIFGRGNRRASVFLACAGVFLACAAMAREAFLLLIPIIFVYFWFYRNRRFIAPLFIPLVLVLLVFYAPSFFDKDSGNAYSKLFFREQGQSQSYMDFENYGHLFPDPYTYHFEKSVFLKNYGEKINRAGFLESLQMKKVLANIGERGVGIAERFFLGSVLLVGHLGYFFSLEKGGGPFVLFFSVVGLLFYLKNKNKDLFRFLVFWILGTLLFLSYVVLASRTHLMDFCWAIPFLAALGVYHLPLLFKEKFNFSEKKYLLFSSFFVFVFLYNIFLADHVVFGKVYDDTGGISRIGRYAEAIKNEIDDKSVVAVGFGLQDATLLNYLSEKSLIVFTPETVARLIQENKLKEAFDNFGVNYVLGYDEKLSEEISGVSGAISIFPDFSDKEQPAISPFKSLFLNLIR